MPFVKIPSEDDDIRNPIVIPNPLPVPCFPRTRPTRYWTLEDYERLTRILYERFSSKDLTCAMFNGLDIDPAQGVRHIRELLDEAIGEEEGETRLRAILAALLLIYGYVRKIRATRIYRIVLRRFIIFALLLEAIESIIDALITVIGNLEAITGIVDDLLVMYDCHEHSYEDR